jgi:hypothetical protein
VNVKEAFKIHKDKMMLAKIESWKQKKNIIINKSKLKEKKKMRGCIQVIHERLPMKISLYATQHTRNP